MTAARRGSRGFTLVEVLAALAILGLALGAGLRSGGLLVDSVERQALSMLSEACAENALAELRLAGSFPEPGSSRSECRQGGSELWIELAAYPTPNPSFRRVDARAGAGSVRYHASSALAPEF